MTGVQTCALPIYQDGLRRTVEWYRENRDWWEPIKHGGGFAAYRKRQYGA